MSARDDAAAALREAITNSADGRPRAIRNVPLTASPTPDDEAMFRDMSAAADAWWNWGELHELADVAAELGVTEEWI